MSSVAQTYTVKWVVKKKKRHESNKSTGYLEEKSTDHLLKSFNSLIILMNIIQTICHKCQVAFSMLVSSVGNEL